MQFKLDEAIEILSRTPFTLNSMVGGLSEQWISSNEAEGTWSAFDVVGHLIDGEINNWIVRIEIILKEGTEKDFPPFDRFEHVERNKKKSLDQLLEEFNSLREENLKRLRTLIVNESDYTLKGIHPEFGEVTLHQLLSTWVVHDLTHIAQISRVMAHRYKEDVGPWKAYLRILSI
ncbi:DinB family protein [Alkalihalobacillus sp. AL-G]|uniref:DinB family protein n=1 Tax=Alkalihalobacillus sp. AL-G TaxID=2926399 RepID=UPI00272CE532|nr:DinB family protein [Alkalihalobacillus sp. AL-G]WLD93957.1 DinB family protein [Alkalihalobacillus sp. AL-G]